MNKLVDLVFLSSPALGGAERILRTIAEETAQSGQHVLIVFLCYKGYAKWQGLPESVTCVYLGAPREKLGMLLLVKQLLRIRSEYTVRRVYSSKVHLNGMLCCYRYLGLLKCDSLVLRESTVVGDRFTGLRKWEFLLVYFFYRNIDLLICQTDYMKKRLLEFVPRLVHYSPVVIPNPVNAERAVQLSSEQCEDDAEDFSPYVVTVGRLIHTKGVDILIEAFKQLTENYPNHQLILIGSGSGKAKYEALVAHLGIQDKVVFLGQKSNPFPYLKKADLGVISSRKEGFPNVLLEMMTVCKRVVSTRCAGGIDKIPGIEHCEAGDVDALHIAMERALDACDDKKVALMRAEVQRRTPTLFLQNIGKLLAPRMESQ